MFRNKDICSEILVTNFKVSEIAYSAATTGHEQISPRN